MNSCPLSNFIGNRCMPDPVQPESIAEKNQMFAEEASFFAAAFRNIPVRPMPDPGLMLILNKQWLERKKRTVTKKGKPEQLWLGKRPDRENTEDPDQDEVI